ncbi:MAG: DUF5777 family beta-barrel protein [Thermoanaerobaculia bacterium]
MPKRSVLLAALALFFVVATVPPLEAQEAPPWEPGYGDRFLQTASPLVNEKGILQAIFTHRFNQPVNSAGGNNLFGLDSGANIGLGVGYVPVDHLSIDVYRASSGGDYEFAAKYALLVPTAERPFGIAVRGGLDWLTKFEIDQKVGGFGQILIAATLWDRVTLAAAPSFVSNTPLFRNVYNVPLAVQVKIAKGLFATGEYVLRNKDLDGSVGQWSFALEKRLWLHRFSVWIGNSAATTVDQILAGDYAGGVRESNIRLGFNIIRQFEIAVR